jgi:hypothetical protein
MEINHKTGRSEDEASIRRYLLGVLPDAEAEQLEQRCAGDEARFEEIQEIEDELIDDYASGALAGQDRTRFEEYFLCSPERREKLRFALTITEHAVGWKKQIQAGTPPLTLVSKAPIDATEAAPRPRDALPSRGWSQPVPAWRQWLAIAAAVLIAVTAGALWLRNLELRQDLLSANAEEVRLRTQGDAAAQRAELAEAEAAVEKKERQEQETALLARMQQSEKMQPARTVTAFLGLADLVRITRSGSVGEAKTIKVPSNSGAVRLTVQFEATRFHGFIVAVRRGTVAVQHGEEGIAWSSSRAIEAREIGATQNLVLRIPGRRLSAGAYTLIVRSSPSEGNVEVAQYLLNIVR